MVNAKEFVEMLRISRRKFDTMYLNGEIPACLRIGRQRFWRPEDIAAWMGTLVEPQASVSMMRTLPHQQRQQP
nr:helix-turn-helix domain-containing protein [Burkholderia gladioli]